MWVRAKFYKIPFLWNLEDTRQKRFRWYWIFPFLVMYCIHDIFDHICWLLWSILSLPYECDISYEVDKDDYEEYRRQNSDIL